ncbi:MAG: hypothetical protein AAFR11_12245 [Pseudomonadota bacterium]
MTEEPGASEGTVEAGAVVQSERRLVRRVTTVWTRLCDEGGFPKPAALKRDQFGADWDQCFILDLERSAHFPFFTHLGDEVREYCGVMLSGGDDWRCTLLTKATERAGEVARTAAPVPVEDVLTRFDGKRLAFRVILLPLCADPDGPVTDVLGAVSGRLFEPYELAEAS